MQIKPRLYPHPVLAWFADDYMSCMYQPAINVEGNKGFFKISMTCRTSSKSLNSLIAEKKAAFAIHVECSATRYRALFSSFEGAFEVDIPVGDLEGKVDVCRLIIAKEDILNYSSPEFHADFSGRSFSIIAGDTLAVAEDVSFPADKKEDELAKLPSIFSVKRNDAEDPNPIDIDISDQKIRVLLMPELHQKFLYLNTDVLMRSTLASEVLLPALVFTLEKISSQSEYTEFMDLRWYRVLARKLKEEGVDITDLSNSQETTLVLANQLLGNPLSNSLKDLETALMSEDN